MNRANNFKQKCKNRDSKYQHQSNATTKFEMLLKSWLALKTGPEQFELMQMAFVQQ